MAAQSRIRADAVYGPLADPVEHRKTAAQQFMADYKVHALTLKSDALHSAIQQLGECLVCLHLGCAR
jgi:hypothetical protein